MTDQAKTDEPQYAVVSPMGRFLADPVSEVAGVQDFNHKKIGFIWDYEFRGNLMFEHIRAGLEREWPGVEIVGYDAFGNFHGPEENEIMAGLPARLKEEKVDAVVVGVGACGACTPAVMRVCVLAEREGIPSAALVSEGFRRQGEAIAAALGLATDVIARYPGVVLTDGLDTFHAKVEETMVPDVIARLRRVEAGTASTAAAPAEEEFDPRRVVFTGTLDGVQRHFDGLGWTDGLPVVPPTLPTVERFLANTPRPAEDVIGVLLPANREVTVWTVAVNAALAGCDPALMPLCVAAAEAIADPLFGIEHAGATPGWEPLAIVSGPDSAALGFNSGQGALRYGVRANATLGRFVKTFMRNCAGIAAPMDKGTFGGPMQVALAEDEAATRDVGWPALREEQGFGAADTSVTVMSVIGFSLPIYSEGDGPEPHLRIIAEHIEGVSGHWSQLGLTHKNWRPLLIMTPAIARVFADAGMGKDDIRRDLGDRARVPLSRWTNYTTQIGISAEWLAEALADPSIARAAYNESTDPDRPVPVIPYPERLSIVVAGDPARNQSKYYVNNQLHAPQVAKKVQWPPR